MGWDCKADEIELLACTMTGIGYGLGFEVIGHGTLGLCLLYDNDIFLLLVTEMPK